MGEGVEMGCVFMTKSPFWTYKEALRLWPCLCSLLLWDRPLGVVSSEHDEWLTHWNIKKQGEQDRDVAQVRWHRGKKNPKCGTSVCDGNWPHLRERREQDWTNIFISSPTGTVHLMGIPWWGMNISWKLWLLEDCIQNDNSAVVKKKLIYLKGCSSGLSSSSINLQIILTMSWYNTQHETQRLVVYAHKWQRKAASLYIWEDFVPYGCEMLCGK